MSTDKTYAAVRQQLLGCRDNPHATQVRRPGHAHEANRRLRERIAAQRASRRPS